jgi:hypothetical protein
MSVATEIPTKNRTIILTIGDKLDFTMCQVSSWKASNKDGHQKISFVVDLAKVESIRGSGQNLLQMLKECAIKEQANINIIHCSPHLRKELCELRLDEYFSIE